jgi:hypothetical protein
MTPEQWRDLIEAAPGITPVEAHDFVKAMGGNSNAVAVLAKDGRQFVVKRCLLLRGCVNDLVVGLLGNALDAPVAKAGLVYVPQVLIDAHPGMRHLPEGVSYGSEMVQGTSDAGGFSFPYCELPENRSRYARLAFLYGWVGADDVEVKYRTRSPELVWSVDHDQFFPGRHEWTPETLREEGAPLPYTRILKKCDFTPAEIEAAQRQLAAVSVEAIAAAVAAPPDDWGMTMEERVALAEYLYTRQQRLRGWQPPDESRRGPNA